MMAQNQPKNKKKEDGKHTAWVLACDGRDQEHSLGSAAEPGREPTAGIPLLRSQQLCLSSLIVSDNKNKYLFFPLPKEAGAARELEVTNPSVTEPRSPASVNHPEKASWLLQPVNNREQPQPALLKRVRGLGERQQDKATYHC